LGEGCDGSSSNLLALDRPKDGKEAASWRDVPGSFYTVGALPEVRHGIQEAIDVVLPRLLGGATRCTELDFQQQPAHGGPRLQGLNLRRRMRVNASKQGFIGQRRDVLRPAVRARAAAADKIAILPEAGAGSLEALRKGLRGMGFESFEPEERVGAEEVLLFSRCNVFVAEWGPNLAYMTLNPQPSFIFALYTPESLRAAKDANSPYSFLHHVLYVFDSSEVLLEPTATRDMLEKMRLIVRSVPRSLGAERARRYVSERGVSCPSGLLSNCAIDHWLAHRTYRNAPVPHRRGHSA